MEVVIVVVAVKVIVLVSNRQFDGKYTLIHYIMTTNFMETKEKISKGSLQYVLFHSPVHT